MPHYPKEKFKTEHAVFDRFTNNILHKLIRQGYFEGIESAIALGKEANVFSALRSDGTRVAVKIYRLETSDFNKMYDYLREDPRYALLKGKKRKVIFHWVQREYRNLLKARDAGVTVPTPLTFNKNVLVMDYIGGDIDVAPRLVSVVPPKKKAFFDSVVDNIKKLYDAEMVHADLSAFNILYDEDPVFIDLSQTITSKHQRFHEFLVRDIHNVCQYFTKIGLNVDEKKVLKKITGKKT
jgi:RIO kinase 1|tara:strand:+ start:590 stop:1303 length:714 start_codon:yes stop_codon:yes gene_type:complete